MVKFVDGYTEEKKVRGNHKTLVELAQKHFSGNNISGGNEKHITIYEGKTGHDVDIYPGLYSTVIEVNEKSHFARASMLASEAEELGIENIQLRTTYQH